MCNIHGYWHECHGIPIQLYLVALYSTLAFTGLYLACEAYNLLWLLVPRMGRLSSLMETYRAKMVRAKVKGDKQTSDSYIVVCEADLYVRVQNILLILSRTTYK